MKVIISETQGKILMTLRDFGKLATSRVAGIVGLDHTHCLKLLNQLEESNYVTCQYIENTSYVYWDITKEGLLKLKEIKK